MTTIYSKYPHKKSIKELHKTDDHPKIALQKFLDFKGYSEESKNIKQIDSGYQVQVGKHTLLAY